MHSLADLFFANERLIQLAQYSLYSGVSRETPIYCRCGYNTKAELQSGICNGFNNLANPIDILSCLMPALTLSGTSAEQRKTK